MKKIVLITWILGMALMTSSCRKEVLSDHQIEVDSAEEVHTEEIVFSPEDAKAAAFADAGVTEDSATIVKAKRDRDDGRVIYDIEFYINETNKSNMTFERAIKELTDKRLICVDLEDNIIINSNYKPINNINYSKYIVLDATAATNRYTSPVDE